MTAENSEINRVPTEKDLVRHAANLIISGFETGYNLTGKETSVSIELGEDQKAVYTTDKKGTRTLNFRLGTQNGKVVSGVNDAEIAWGNHNGKGENGGPETRNSPLETLDEIIAMTFAFIPNPQESQPQVPTDIQE